MNIAWLTSDDTEFPEVSNALTDPNGLLAAGGDLSPERLLSAYRHGIFPWFSEDEPIMWWSPDPRCVLYVEDFKVSRSLAKEIKKPEYSIRYDHDFEQTIRSCTAPRKDETGTWITTDMMQAYITLHKLGYAHSVEVWDGETLVGGLYGVDCGRVFSGESMFSKRPNASKIALFHLVQHLKVRDYILIDCQVESEHLMSLGATNIPRTEFLEAVHAPGKTGF